MDEKTSLEIKERYPDLYDYWWNQGYQVGKRTGWREGREHARENIKKKLKENGLISIKESKKTVTQVSP